MITHAVITGVSKSGKSTLAKSICAQMARLKRPILVFDPIMEGERGHGLNGWPRAAMVFGDWEPFKAAVWSSRGCLCVVDECADVVEDDPKGLRRMMRKGRHVNSKRVGGHAFVLIAQRYRLSLDKSARDQASHVFAFVQSDDDAMAMADDFNAPRLAQEVPRLPRLHYIQSDKYGNTFRGVATFKK